MDPVFEPQPKIALSLRDRIDISMGLKAPLNKHGDDRIVPQRVDMREKHAAGPGAETWLAAWAAAPKSDSSTWGEFIDDAFYLGNASRGSLGACKWSIGSDADGLAWLVGIDAGIRLTSAPPTHVAYVLVCDSMSALKKAWAASREADGLADIAGSARAFMEAQELREQISPAPKAASGKGPRV